MTVLKWLQGHGVEDCRSVTTLDFLECYLPASTAERLLPGAEFHRYMQGQLSLVRSPLPYTVPAELAEHLDFGTSHLGEVRLQSLLQIPVPWDPVKSAGGARLRLSRGRLKRLFPRARAAGLGNPSPTVGLPM